MNNNFSKLGKQLLDIWGQLGASQRISVIAATFVLLAGLSTVTFWSSHKDYGLLYGGLSDAESSKVVAALEVCLGGPGYQPRPAQVQAAMPALGLS